MSLNMTVVGKEEVLADLRVKGPELRARVVRTITELTYKLQRYVIEQKLHGQVLNQRSGRLARSISARVVDSGDEVYGIVGTNVVYAAIHEYGGTINHPGGTAFLIERNTALARFIKNSDPLADHLPRTKPHAIPMPERSFLRSALRDLTPDIQFEIAEAIRGI